MEKIKHFTSIGSEHTIAEVHDLLDNNYMSYDSLWYQNLTWVLKLGDMDLLKKAINYVTVRRSLVLSETTNIRKSSKDTAILDAIIISNNLSDTHYNITGLYNLIKPNATIFDELWESDVPDEVKNDMAHVLTIMGNTTKDYQPKDTDCENRNHHLFNLLIAALHFNNAPSNDYCEEFVIQFALDQRSLAILKPDIAPFITPHIQIYLDEFGYKVEDWRMPTIAKNLNDGNPVHTLQPSDNECDYRGDRGSIFDTPSHIFDEDEIGQINSLINSLGAPGDIQWVFDKYTKYSHEMSDVLYTELSILLRSNDYQITIEPRYSATTTSISAQLFESQEQFNDWLLACPEDKQDEILNADVTNTELLRSVSNIINPPDWLLKSELGIIIFGNNMEQKLKLEKILWVQNSLHLDPEFTSEYNWAIELVDYVIKYFRPFSHSVTEHLNFPGLSEESYAILLYMDQHYDSNYDVIEYERGFEILDENSSTWFVDFCHFVRMYITPALDFGVKFEPNLKSSLMCMTVNDKSKEYKIRENLLNEVL